MARIWQTNDNNDIFTTPGGRLAQRTDLQAILQQAEHAMSAQLGEMIYARDRGVNTDDSVWSGAVNLLSFESFARQQLERIPSIINIEDFQARLDGNTIRYTTTLRTRFGAGTITG